MGASLTRCVCALWQRVAILAALLLVGAPITSACSAPGGSADGDAGSDRPRDGGYADAEAVGFRVQFIDPVHGPYTGGTQVTVRGNGFDESCTVFVGGRMVEPLTQEFVDSRRMRIATPPGQPGLAEVEVLCGDETASLADAFTYEALVVDPPSGTVVGGTRVGIEGFGTDFGEGTEVRFDGALLEDLVVENEQRLVGKTPPGVSGSADVEVTTSTQTFEARGAYTYVATADPFAGGMGGGPITGDINVVVLDANTDNGIDSAYVAVGDPQNSSYQGYADTLGQISFSDSSLTGPVTVTAAAPGYETASFVSYDARDITIFLRRPPEPTPPGPLPPPPQSGRVYGHVVFGSSTGLGSPHWNLVPEPRNADEIKRIYVSTTASSIFSRSNPGKVIDYEGFDASKTAWEFDLRVRPKATAIVAMAGLFNQSTKEFDAFAMGVARGILVGPGEDVVGVDLLVNIPLDSSLLVQLDDAPSLKTPGWDGPIEYTLRPVIELGGEGAIIMSGHAIPQPPGTQLAPGTYRFDEGSTSILVPGVAPLSGPLADASYSFIAGAYSANGSAPFSVRIERGVGDVNVPIHIGGFLGTPRPVDPVPDGLASELAVELASEAPASAVPTFQLHGFSDVDGNMIMRILSLGDLPRTPIPDLGGKDLGDEVLTHMPRGQDVSWNFYHVVIPGLSFDEFNYRHLSINYWSAYASDAYWVQFPEGP